MISKPITVKLDQLRAMSIEKVVIQEGRYSSAIGQQENDKKYNHSLKKKNIIVKNDRFERLVVDGIITKLDFAYHSQDKEVSSRANVGKRGLQIQALWERNKRGMHLIF